MELPATGHIGVRVLAWPERIWMCSWTPANAESSKGTGIKVVLQAQALTGEYFRKQGSAMLHYEEKAGQPDWQSNLALLRWWLWG